MAGGPAADVDESVSNAGTAPVNVNSVVVSVTGASAGYWKGFVADAPRSGHGLHELPGLGLRVPQSLVESHTSTPRQL